LPSWMVRTRGSSSVTATRTAVNSIDAASLLALVNSVVRSGNAPSSACATLRGTGWVLELGHAEHYDELQRSAAAPRRFLRPPPIARHINSDVGKGKLTRRGHSRPMLLILSRLHRSSCPLSLPARESGRRVDPAKGILGQEAITFDTVIDGRLVGVPATVWKPADRRHVAVRHREGCATALPDAPRTWPPQPAANAP